MCTQQMSAESDQSTESSLHILWVAKNKNLPRVDSKDADHFVGFVLLVKMYPHHVNMSV